MGKRAKWEYKLIYNVDLDKLAAALKAAGADGWEAVGVAVGKYGGEYTVVLLKREIE